jgi:hypothetical protein
MSANDWLFWFVALHFAAIVSGGFAGWLCAASVQREISKRWRWSLVFPVGFEVAAIMVLFTKPL